MCVASDVSRGFQILPCVVRFGITKCGQQLQRRVPWQAVLASERYLHRHGDGRSPRQSALAGATTDAIDVLVCGQGVRAGWVVRHPAKHGTGCLEGAAQHRVAVPWPRMKGPHLTNTRHSHIVDLATLQIDTIVADKEEIRKFNPQRFDMEQIDAVMLEDGDRGICVGYKDVRMDEFWVTGHMPDMPLMPGVLICEAAAQLASYFTLKYDLLGAQLVGLGGMEAVRFRGRVVPGDRLVIALELVRVRRGALIVCRFEGFVKETLVVDGRIIGARLQ